MGQKADNVLFEIDLSELGPDFDVHELTDEMLFEIAGGRRSGNGKLICPKGQRMVCGTRDGKYICICE